MPGEQTAEDEIIFRRREPTWSRRVVPRPPDSPLYRFCAACRREANLEIWAEPIAEGGGNVASLCVGPHARYSLLGPRCMLCPADAAFQVGELPLCRDCAAVVP
jgi:hypothetical protein